MAGERINPSPRTIRFGPFGLDVRAAELRKHGIRIRLHEQPFRILLMLLNHHGEVVLRDEIRLALWPNDTIVEFDHSINAAIQRLRDALGDSADNPRYVETLARRGYRFIGTVEPEVPAPAVEVPAPPAAEPVSAVDPSDLSGQTFSHFRVIGKLGSGGMGVVYRAEDLKLGRQVALKFLPLPAHEAPAGLLDRFQREARAASALNHPNICTIYGVEELAGQPVIVMELLEGETLQARLAKGPLALEKALPLAVQLAAALDAAHRKGVVHRDLKPANIMLTKSGLKVLDFGLAKMERAAAGEEETVTEVTQAGTILGTWQYMSPEQAQGRDADARSDLFSFGCVLLEMLTGSRAFAGDTPADLIGAILTKDPLESANLATPLPPALANVIRHCLEKSPGDRFQTAHDLTFALEALSGSSAASITAVTSDPGGAHRVKLAWSLAAVATAGLATVAFLHFREKPPALPPPARFQIPAPENATLLLNLSPDGRKLAFIAGGRLWVHSLESGESRDLMVVSGGVPFWSPDSRLIGYPSQGKLKKIPATGGPPQTVTDLRGNLWGGGSWNQDDVIVFGERQVGLFRVPASGGVPVQITALDPARHEKSHYSASFLPDGRHFVYIRASTDEARSAIYLGSMDAKPEQQSSKPLVASNWQPVYAPSVDPSTGYLLFMREGTLMAQPFDNRRLELKGQAAPVAEQVSDNGGGAGAWGAFSASANDVLVYLRSAASDRQLTWFDREGKVMGTVGEPGAYGGLELSPDGTRVATTRARGADASNIWLLDLSRGGASTRFTFDAAVDTDPIWSPDGSRLIFSSNRDGPYNLYQKAASGVKDEEVLLKSSEDKYATSWSRDGRFLLYTAVHPKTNADIWVLPLEGDRKPIPYLTTEFNERQARFSPDGHRVAYTSDESGQDEVYVRSFSVNSAGTAVEPGAKWPISNGSGADPRWRGDGQALYYRARDGRLMAVEIATSPAFRAGNPQPFGVSTFALWDSAADGRRYLSLANKSGPPMYTVVLNWQAGLKK